MVRYPLTVSLLALASSLTGVMAKATEATDVQGNLFGTVVRNRWIVVVDENTDPAPLREKLKHDDIKIRKDFDYPIFKGASIEITNPETSEDLIEMLNGLSGVTIDPVKRMARSISDASPVENSENPERLHKRDPSEVNTVDPLTGLNFDSTHDMTQVTKLHKAGYFGGGVNIAIIGSGIDYLHPDLGGCFGTECLVDRGYDFVGDDYDGFSEPVPDDDPMDCAGSGTHMAGIIAAQGKQWKFTGAAPEATLGAYKVFGCNGAVNTDILIEAFYKAYEDGAGIITSSISRPSGWSNNPLAEMIQWIVKKGVPCIMPSGDDGNRGLFYASDTASAKGVYAVGSINNVNTPKLAIPSNYSIDGGEPIEFQWTKGRPYKLWDNVQDYQLFPVGLNAFSSNNGCSSQDYGSNSLPNLDNKVVLIRRGGCKMIKKASIASELGAKYVIIYNDIPGTIEIHASHLPNLKGIAMVEAEVGEAWINEIAAGKTITLTMANPWEVMPKLSIEANTYTGGYVSDFNSWGPTWDMDLRPLVSVPGGNILSTYPRAKGNYAVMSGTAISAPLLAAITALVGSVRESFRTKTTESLLVNYAVPKYTSVVTDPEDSKFIAPVPQQGGGLVQAYDAAFGSTFFTKSHISFNPDNEFQKTVQFEIINFGEDDLSYKVDHMPALTVFAKDTPYESKFGYLPNNMDREYASITLSEYEFTLAPMERKTLTITAEAPKDLDPNQLPVWSGYMVFTTSDDAQMVLPYQGLTGSLKDTRMFHYRETFLTFIPGDEAKPYIDYYHEPIMTNERWILPAQGTAKASAIESTESVPLGIELPGFQIELVVGTPLLRADLIPVSQPTSSFRTRRVLGVTTMGTHPSYPENFLTRNIYVSSFDGLLADGRYAPPGEYRWLIRALRIGGNPKDAWHYDSVETKSFRITYENFVNPEVVAAEREKERPEFFQITSK